jgi:protoporphyrin/coproporphyrin ferrochelatase
MSDLSAATTPSLASNEGRKRIAVVMFNLGGPDSLEAVEPFLFNLFNDPAIIGLPWPLRPLLARLISKRRREEASGNYAHMGGRSPLVLETEAQARALERKLEQALPGMEIRAFLAMRYWRPLTADAVKAVEAFAPDDVVLLPLYPQYSTTTTGSSAKAWKAAYRGTGQVREVCCFFDAAGFAAAYAARIRATFEAAGSPKGLRLLFSAHGLPEQVIRRGDPYQWQVERSCEAIMRELDGTWDWQVCYQSRVGPLKWIGPSTPDAITQAARDGRGVLVVPVAFVSEHVETLVELDRDYSALAEREGCPRYLRAPAVGIEPLFIDALAGLVASALARTGCRPAAGACDRRLKACPYHREAAVG